MRALPFDSDAPLRLAPSYRWEAPPAGQPKHPDTLRRPSAQSVARWEVSRPEGPSTPEAPRRPGAYGWRPGRLAGLGTPPLRQ
ncbi:hypothetical protein SSPO_030550 [Streptomyces antimycoticus]|uniref:Uncharacterized protein n=1 Tax=Streptomyces antimycoticus TaxID=68175 RepID=A0A499V2E4_9ACTN|nr:hypothetical protein SSPO_030550 [Streptomyces antimycoticus]